MSEADLEVDLRGVRPGAAIRYAVHAGVAAVSEKQRHGWIMGVRAWACALAWRLWRRSTPASGC